MVFALRMIFVDRGERTDLCRYENHVHDLWILLKEDRFYLDGLTASCYRIALISRTCWIDIHPLYRPQLRMKITLHIIILKWKCAIICQFLLSLQQNNVDTWFHDFNRLTSEDKWDLLLSFEFISCDTLAICQMALRCSVEYRHKMTLCLLTALRLHALHVYLALYGIWLKHDIRLQCIFVILKYNTVI